MTAVQTLISQTKSGEAILVTSDINRRYLSHFNSSAGAILITNSNAYLFLDFRYREMGEKAKENGTIASEILLEDAATFSNLRRVIKKHNIRKLYFEDRRMTCAELVQYENALETVEFDALEDRIERLRVQKTPFELEKIRQAQRLTEEAYAHVLTLFSKSATELALAAEIDCYFRRHGAENAFDTILVSGKNSALPHGRPQDKILSENSFVTMDFGAKVDGYCADMTRTVVFGRADEEMKRIYSLVLNAQNAAFSAIRAGVTGESVDKAARAVIYAAGFEGCFEHGTGHSLGLEIHESPNFNRVGHSPIPTNAVLSVEPGIYLHGKYGVRIEDIVRVTENGFENLTQAKKDLIEL